MIMVSDEKPVGMLFSMFPEQTSKHKKIIIPSLLITNHDGAKLFEKSEGYNFTGPYADLTSFTGKFFWFFLIIINFSLFKRHWYY